VGLIRKTLALGTLGLVRGSSKKQRVAQAQLDELRAQTLLMQEQAAAFADPPDPLDSPVPEVRRAERRRIDAQNQAMGLHPSERQQQVQVLWRRYKDGTLTREQYTVAYEALGNTSPSA
jgi:hypothetical protein